MVYIAEGRFGGVEGSECASEDSDELRDDASESQVADRVELSDSSCVSSSPSNAFSSS